MKRLAFALLFFLALPIIAASDKWADAYHRGVKAVQTKDYATAIDQLQRAIAEMPNESPNAKGREQVFLYVPRFWLGIARYETHDYDGALRDWKASEDQGVVQGTEYYARMREFVAQAQRAKAEAAHNAVAEPRKNADAAMSRAMSAQMEAVGAGGDRVDSYRTGKRKLEQALADFNRAGNDAQVYQRATDGANQARELFVTATDEAKRAKAAKASRPAPVLVAQAKPVVPAPEPQPKVEPVPQPPVESEASVEARIAEQEQHVKTVMSKPAPKAPVVVAEAPKFNPIEPAYRAFANGDLARSEQMLTSMLSQKPTAEAFLLRGCTRYTRAMLSRVPAPLLSDASHDFREAVKLNRSVHLDKSAFSPKLVAFFEQAKDR
jgi:tetratricopeptide (TPR) repeat protein